MAPPPPAHTYPRPTRPRVTLFFLGFPAHPPRFGTSRECPDSPSRVVVATLPDPLSHTTRILTVHDLVVMAKREHLRDDDGVDPARVAVYNGAGGDFAAIARDVSMGVLRDGDALIVAYYPGPLERKDVKARGGGITVVGTDMWGARGGDKAEWWLKGNGGNPNSSPPGSSRGPQEGGMSTVASLKGRASALKGIIDSIFGKDERWPALKDTVSQKGGHGSRGRLGARTRTFKDIIGQGEAMQSLKSSVDNLVGSGQRRRR
ncbi:hypothetical protein HK101_009927 [Irineochytrium annulatum]|nr:hypothetical protein HK101_009927 [Irineochytrium annulatum]